MSDRLEGYLGEIGRYLADSPDRHEILTEIRSHILEKASATGGADDPAALEAAIKAYGSPRRVAERYLDGGPIIAPAFKGYLVRYTLALFAFHVLVTAIAVLSRRTFSLFFYFPRLGPFEALLYLPTAFLADLGLVTLILYLVTRSGKDIRLPWPERPEAAEPAGTAAARASDLAGRIAGLVAVGAIFTVALSIYLRHGTFVFRSWRPFRPLFTPEAGAFYSRAFLVLLGIAFAAQAVRLFTKSEWVKVTESVLSLAVLGIVLSRPFEDLFDPAVAAWPWAPKLRGGLTLAIGIVAFLTAVEIVKAIVVLGRRRYAAGRRRDGVR